MDYNYLKLISQANCSITRALKEYLKRNGDIIDRDPFGWKTLESGGISITYYQRGIKRYLEIPSELVNEALGYFNSPTHLLDMEERRGRDIPWTFYVRDNNIGRRSEEELSKIDASIKAGSNELVINRYPNGWIEISINQTRLFLTTEEQFKSYQGAFLGVNNATQYCSAVVNYIEASRNEIAYYKINFCPSSKEIENEIKQITNQSNKHL